MPPPAAAASSGPEVPTVKVVIVGESNVGKTALLRRFVDASFAPEGLKATIGADFRSRRLRLPNHDGEAVLQVWDTAGQERFRSLSTTYYRGCEGAIVVYDVTSRASFERLPFWLDELLRGTGRTTHEGFSVFVAANKIDAPLAEQQVPAAEAAAWCQARGLSHISVSAKSGANVDGIFIACASSALDYRVDMGDDVRNLLRESMSVSVRGPATGGRNAPNGNGKKCC